MNRIDFLLIIRYIILTVFIILMFYIISLVQDRVLYTFDFDQLHFMNFIGFTLIGSAIHLVDDHILQKDAWALTFKLETLIFVVIYFLIAISLYARIGFLITLYLKTNISASLIIMPFQILFGYTFIKLFLKKG